ncbi:MAG: asparaginase [Oscillospiraceae bacterium]
MKKILFIATGGTIASAPTDSGLMPELSAGTLLAGLGEAALSGVEVHTRQPFSLDSTNLSPENWVQLAVLLRDEWANFDGFVIAHGTDTMAYGAAALCCLIQHPDKPVILTGSQLPMEAPGSDAPRNLADALRCAQQGEAGVWVCFCGRVIAGNAARKVHTTDFDAFRGFTPGEERTVGDFCQPGREPPEGGIVFYNRLDSKAAVLKLTPGISAEMVHDLGVHVNALVVEGFGLGGIPDYGGGALRHALEELSFCGVRVIMTTQVFAGGCDLSVYEVGQSAMNAGVIPAAGMTTEYAVMRAMWALAYSYTAEDFRSIFSGG